MPAPNPVRELQVFVVGAGLSSALGLPNTPSLLAEVTKFARSDAGKWLRDAKVPQRLRTAYEFFYPDAASRGYQPNVVDFFSTLKAFNQVGAGLAGTGLTNTEGLLRDLKRGIAHLLLSRQAKVKDASLREHPYLKSMLLPGNVIITANWDTLIERWAGINSVPLRLTSSSRRFPSTELTVLKLHGSLDWCLDVDRKLGFPEEDFSHLGELYHRKREDRRGRGVAPGESPFPLRVLHEDGNTWQRIKSRASVPLMVTMSSGKADDLGPLLPVWRDAYRALSKAERIEIVGYSMPPDDVEIRTILRAGVRRLGDGKDGPASPNVVVRNPAPDVHERVRSLLERDAESDYRVVPPLS